MSMGMPDRLSVREHMALDLAGHVYKYKGKRASDVRELIGLSEARFWQLVNSLVDRPAAEAEYVALVRRMRRLREARCAQRSADRPT